jgi:hypothetical protein
LFNALFVYIEETNKKMAKREEENQSLFLSSPGKEVIYYRTMNPIER